MIFKMAARVSRHILFIVLLLSVAIPDAFGQPNIIFRGGSGAGYLAAQYDGDPILFKGGQSDGFTISSKKVENQMVFEGGVGQGYFLAQASIQNTFIYKGGQNSGYFSDQWLSNRLAMYRGGIDDGYASLIKLEDFVWTGSIGTGWLVAGNWNTNAIPNVTRNVIVPGDVSNFPHLNEGIFAIGENPNSGAYACKTLWIQTGGLLLTRVNNFVENYGSILIDGTMEVKNPGFNAFRNDLNGQVIISQSGILKFIP